MSYRGPALYYKIRKVTTNNKTGDSYAITVPRIVAQKFENCFFKLDISGNTIFFQSGCRLTINDIEVNKTRRMIVGPGIISFK